MPKEFPGVRSGLEGPGLPGTQCPDWGRSSWRTAWRNVAIARGLRIRRGLDRVRARPSAMSSGSGSTSGCSSKLSAGWQASATRRNRRVAGPNVRPPVIWHLHHATCRHAFPLLATLHLDMPLFDRFDDVFLVTAREGGHDKTDRSSTVNPAPLTRSWSPPGTAPAHQRSPATS